MGSLAEETGRGVAGVSSMQILEHFHAGRRVASGDTKVAPLSPHPIQAHQDPGPSTRICGWSRRHVHAQRVIIGLVTLVADSLSRISCSSWKRCAFQQAISA
jgi:hypothetical protein